MTRQSEDAFQDHYADDVAHCFGCGRLNARGHHIQTRWEGEETVTHFTPEPHHTAIPGCVYGGLIASLVDCHGTATAAAAAARAAASGASGRGMPGELPRFVTASLHIDYLRPTPLGPQLEILGRPTELKRRKVVVQARVVANSEVTARAVVIAVRMPEAMLAR